MTIKVTYNNNVDRQHVLVDNSMTIRAFCEDNGVDYSRGGLNLDGSPLRPGDIDKSFEQMNVAEHCYLLSVVKADNAA